MREARVVPRLEALLEGLVADRERSEDSIAEALKRARSGEPGTSAAEEIPVEVREEVIAGTLQRHYRTWLDEPVPALGDLTPREAARDPAHRGTLRRLLKDIEDGARRQLPSGAWDGTWMWAELGLKR